MKKDNESFLLSDEADLFDFLPNGAKGYGCRNEQTIEANRLQSYRDAAEKELAEWIRFSSRDAKICKDGLTAASMEIAGLSSFVVRNFYNKESVMKKLFRDENIENVIKQVSASAGWLLITSKYNAVVLNLI